MSAEPLTDDSPIDPDDELLVAYLDGELDNQSRNVLEQRLIDDQPLRMRLQSLQASWELLEEWPDPSPNEKSVETTMEFVVSELGPKQPLKVSTYARYRDWIWAGVASAIAMTVVATVMIVIRHQNYRQQLADLALAENMQAYLHGADLSLMRELAANDRWQAELSLARQIGELKPGTTTQVSDLPVEARGQVIPNLSIDDRARIALKWEQFQALTPQVQNQIRQTAAAVAIQPDAKSLLETMHLFAVWQERLPAHLRDEIESVDPTVRTTAIDSAIKFTRQHLSERSGVLLDEETTERIYYVLKQIRSQRLATLSPEDRSRREQFAQRLPGNSGERWQIMMFLDTKSGASRWTPRDHPLTDDEWKLIDLILPTAARNNLSRLSEDDPDAYRAILKDWCEQVVKSKRRQEEGESPTLLERYDNIDPDYRRKLDLLPASEIIDQLFPEDNRSRLRPDRPMFPN